MGEPWRVPWQPARWYTLKIKSVALLILALSILFGAFLGVRPLMVPDEGRYAEIPREMIALQDYVTPHVNYIKYFEKPPLFYWLQTLSIHIFGTSNAALRLMTTLLGLLGCLVVYGTARQLFDHRTGWISALILATSGLYFEMARYITLDMAVTFFLTATLCSFLCALQQPIGRKRNYYLWLMYGCAALATLTKGLIGVIFPGMIIGCWVLLTNNWRALKTYCLPTGILLWLAIVLPWHILVQSRNPEFFHFYVIQQQFARYLTPIANRSAPWWFFSAFLVAGFLPWTCFLVQAIKYHWPWHSKSNTSSSITLLLLLWAVLIFGFFQFSHSQLPPYILPALPPLAMLVGHYLAELSRKQHVASKGLWGAWLVTIALALGLAIYGITQQFSYWLLLLPFLVGGILYYSYRRWQVLGAIIGLMLSMAPVLWVGDYVGSVPIAQQKTTQTLASNLKPLLKPQDQVASYHGYYQDLPFYLQRRIVLVGWGDSELNFGMAHQDMTDWLWPEQTLWQRWNCATCPQIFLFMDKKDYNRLTKNPAVYLKLVGTSDRSVVVTNR